MNYQSNFTAFQAASLPVTEAEAEKQPCFEKESFSVRLLDISVSLFAFLTLAPLMLVLIVLIRLGDGGSALYKQPRIGKNGKVFNCWKFRSMVTNSSEVLADLLENNPEAAAEWQKDQKLKNDPRITKIGALIRKTSLDELPQLWNILKGDMSLVGPRPIVKNEVEKYGDYISYYKAVKPGVTGLWQVSGRNDTTYDERVQMDVSYVENKSILSDLKIIILTIPAVLFSKGAY